MHTQQWWIVYDMDYRMSSPSRNLEDCSSLIENRQLILTEHKAMRAIVMMGLCN